MTRSSINNPFATYSLVNTVAVGTKTKIDQGIYMNGISNLIKLLRVTALVFLRKIKNRVPSEYKTENWKALCVSDLNDAEKFWIKVFQTTSFVEKSNFLRKWKNKLEASRFTSRNLNCSWRTKLSSVRLESVIHHFLLTQEILFSCLRNILLFTLVIRDALEAIKHRGIRDTLTTLRE